MAYPYQITTTPTVAPDFFNGRPIARSSTVLYKHLVDNFNDTLEVWKSTDAGLTWSEQDAANHPATWNSILPMDYCDDGIRLRFMTQNGAASPRLYIFNTSTDLWEAAVTGGPAAQATSGGTNVNPWKQYGIEVRSNGDVVVFYNVQGSGNLSEIWCQVYSGGSWGAAFEVLVQNFNEAGFTLPYSFMGSDIDDDDQIHVYGWTPNGLAYVRVNDDDSLSNYYRFDEDEATGIFVGGRAGIYGEVRVVELANTRYAAMPHAFTQNIDGDVYLRPGMILFPTDGTPAGKKIELFEDDPMNLDGPSVSIAWISVNVAYDATTGVTWLLWTTFEAPTPSTQQFVLRGASTKGGGWSAVSTIFTPPVDDLLETIESTVENNVLRMLFQASSDGTYLNPHYFQTTLSSTAPAICTTDFSGQDLSGYDFSNANFTGAILTGATGLPPTVPTLPQSADPPLPPVWPYPFGGGVLYDREHLGMNIRMIREDDYVFSFQVIDELGNAYDLTDCSLKMTVKWNVRDADASAIFVCTSDPADGITINSPASDGDVTVEIASAKTTPLPLHRVFLPYDIRLTTATDKIKTIIHGTLRVDPNVTDPT